MKTVICIQSLLKSRPDHPSNKTSCNLYSVEHSFDSTLQPPYARVTSYKSLSFSNIILLVTYNLLQPYTSKHKQAHAAYTSRPSRPRRPGLFTSFTELLVEILTYQYLTRSCGADGPP